MSGWLARDAEEHVEHRPADRGLAERRRGDTSSATGRPSSSASATADGRAAGTPGRSVQIGSTPRASAAVGVAMAGMAAPGLDDASPPTPRRPGSPSPAPRRRPPSDPCRCPASSTREPQRVVRARQPLGVARHLDRRHRPPRRPRRGCSRRATRGRRRPAAAPRRRRRRTGVRMSLPATSIGSPPKNCTSDEPARGAIGSCSTRPRRRRPRRRPAGPHRPGHRCRRGTGVVTPARRRGDIGGEPILRPWPPASQPNRLAARWSTGSPVEVPDDGASLLEVLRDRLGVRSPKDGCSPQGQCGCCTVLVDGAPRVACVTPARRVAGRAVTTARRPARRRSRALGRRLLRHRRQPVRLLHPGHRRAGSRACARSTPAADHAAVEQALARPPVPLHRLAHHPRRVGRRAAGRPRSRAPRPRRAPRLGPTLEGGGPQRVAPDVALGQGGFADDTAPRRRAGRRARRRGRLGRRRDAGRGPRARPGKVQGRRTTVDARHPLEVPPGDWAATLRTTWVEPAYLEPDASWCEPGGEPASPLANGGAFGGKLHSAVGAAARRLADEHGRPVRVLLSARTSCASGPKRPPIAAGVRRRRARASCGSSAPPGIAAAIAAVAPGLVVEEVDVPGRRPRRDLRAAGWAEAAVLLAGARGAAGPVTDPSHGRDRRGRRSTGDGIRVRVDAGDPLDEVVLRSYCIGAAHMALSLGAPRGHRRRRRRRRSTTSRSAPSASCGPSTCHRSRSRSTPSRGPPVNGVRRRVRRGGRRRVAATTAVPTDWPTGARWR